MLLNLIIAALAMNFSMFFGRVIIDMGNFTGSIFYRMTNIHVSGSGPAGDATISGQSESYLQKDTNFAFANAILGLGEKDAPFYGKKSIATALLV
jgi:hypothetical protein